jgi:hypothetical protein
MGTGLGTVMAPLGRAIAFGLGFAALAACSGLSPGATSTASPIVGAEVPAASVVTTSTSSTKPGSPSSVPSAGDCLSRADETALVGEPCIRGSEVIVIDTTKTESAQKSLHTVTPERIDFSLWAVAPGVLTGTAHLAYSLNISRVDMGAKRCPEQVEVVDPLSWDVQLAGTYRSASDGSVQVSALATPGQGPGYVVRVEACDIPGVEEPGVPWRGITARLTGGIYDLRIDAPLDPNTTGEKSTTIHVEELSGS